MYMRLVIVVKPARTVGKLVGDARSQTQIRCRGLASQLEGGGRLPLDLIAAGGAVAVASCELAAGWRLETTDSSVIASVASFEVAISTGQIIDPSFLVSFNQYLVPL